MFMFLSLLAASADLTEVFLHPGGGDDALVVLFFEIEAEAFVIINDGKAEDLVVCIHAVERGQPALGEQQVDRIYANIHVVEDGPVKIPKYICVFHTSRNRCRTRGCGIAALIIFRGFP